MQQIENPFTDADTLLDESSEPLPPVRLVDFHCELTSEKNAFGLHLDGRVSAVVGTHTHVVTGDERILPGGTAYQTDLGMTGPVWSVIGFDPKTVLPRFINALPTRFEVGDGAVVFNATQIDIDPATGRALAIERIQPARRGLEAATRHAASRQAGPRPADRRAAPRPSTCTRTRCAPTASSTPVELVRDAAAAGVRTLAITDHDTLAAYRDLTRRGRCRPAIELITGVEINALARGIALQDGELHILGFGMDPTTRRSRRRSRRSGPHAGSGSSGPFARLREIGMPIDDQLAGLDPGRRRRPRPADDRPGADRGRLRDERRGRVPSTDRLGRPRIRAARGDGPEGGDRRDPGGRRVPGARPLLGGASARSPCCASSRELGLRRPRGLLPHVPARNGRRRRAPSLTSSASSPRAVPTTTATSELRRGPRDAPRARPRRDGPAQPSPSLG